MVQITRGLLDAYIQCCAGRRDSYALQHTDGRYHRVLAPLSYEAVFQHIQGIHTIGSYLIDEDGLCSFAVFDSDLPSGLTDLFDVQTVLASNGIPSYLEMSRRGAHLRVFLIEPAPPAFVRQWLLPFCPAGVEFYPKQDVLTDAVPFGSLIRLPLGVHQQTGQYYPFVTWAEGQWVPVASSLVEMLRWFSTVQRVRVPVLSALPVTVPAAAQTHIPFNNPLRSTAVAPTLSIRDWCAQYDPLEVIGRYVSLDQKGIGCCPFGWHHADGVDTHPSFWVYRPSAPDICCWYCHTWRQGGSLFDFLRYYYGLDARELWSHILQGGHF